MSTKPRAATYEIGEERRGDDLVVRLSGRLDLAAAGVLEETLTGAAARRLALRLDGVTYLSSSGVAVLVRLATGARRVALCRPAPCVRDVLSLAGLDQVLAIHADEEAALRGP